VKAVLGRIARGSAGLICVAVAGWLSTYLLFIVLWRAMANGLLFLVAAGVVLAAIALGTSGVAFVASAFRR
jgi:hypothetical protein